MSEKQVSFKNLDRGEQDRVARHALAEFVTEGLNIRALSPADARLASEEIARVLDTGLQIADPSFKGTSETRWLNYAMGIYYSEEQDPQDANGRWSRFPTESAEVGKKVVAYLLDKTWG